MKERLATFVAFMCESFPDAEEKISFQMPTYKINGIYIAFSTAKEYFIFHMLDFEMIEELKCAKKLLTEVISLNDIS
jgi:uncharacterized protein YdhG (YjbR/CyaY superfamily)